MSTLGFDNYVEPLKLYLQKYREAMKGERQPGDGFEEIDDVICKSLEIHTQSQKIGIYNPFSIPALKWDLKSNLNLSFKTLVNLNPCLKMGSTIQSRSLF